MTDNDIIKALECCSSPQVNACDDCPFHERCYNNDEFIEKEAIDLINRQKAEIERLNFENLQMIASIKHLRAEAVKEFAERLKIKGTPEYPWEDFSVCESDIDEVREEMVGESK